MPGSLKCYGQCNLSCEKKSSYVASGDKLAKLGALLKICLFTWDIGVLRILIKRKNSEPSWKDALLQFYVFSRILRCSFVVFASFLGKWWWFFILNEPTDRSVHSEIISCTRTPEFLGERTSFHPWWAGKEKQPPVRMNFSSRTDQLMPTKWRPGKTEHLFHRTPPSGYFCRCSFRGWWQIFFLMWTWGAPLATCILDIYSLKSIRYLFNKIQLLKKSFNNIKDQCQNMNFNTPIDTSA